jgi:hypothetical protein
MDEGSHYLLTVTHKVSDHHLHQWQALAANILHRLHVVAVDKSINLLKFQVTQLQKNLQFLMYQPLV